MGKGPLPAGTTIVNGNLVIPVGNNRVDTGNAGVNIKAVAGVNNAGAEIRTNAPFTATGTANTTPVAPSVTASDVDNWLDFSHALGDAEIVVSENAGAYVAMTTIVGWDAATGRINVGNVARAIGYWKAKTKAATGRNESAAVDSPAFTVTQAAAPYATRFRFIGDNHIGMTTNEPVTLGNAEGYTFTGNGLTITPSTFSGTGTTEIVFGFGHSLAGLAVSVAYDQATGNTVNAAGVELLPFVPTPFSVGHSWVRLIDEFVGTAGTDLLDHTPDEGTKWSGTRGDFALDGSGSVYPLVNMALVTNYVEKGYDNLLLRITGHPSGVGIPVYYRMMGADSVYVQYNRNPTPGVGGEIYIIQVIGGVATQLGVIGTSLDLGDYSLKVFHNSSAPGEIRALITNGTTASPDAVGTTTITHGDTTRFGFHLPTGAKISRAYAGIGIDPLA